MRIKFTARLKNIDGLKKKSKENVKNILFLSMSKMEELAKQKAPVDTGQLRRNIRLFPRLPGYKKYTLADGVEYGLYQEFGTKPHYAPISPLQDWAKRVLGDESIAYAVRNKIAKYGLSEKPFFRPAYHEVKNIWLPRYKKKLKP